MNPLPQSEHAGRIDNSIPFPNCHCKLCHPRILISTDRHMFVCLNFYICIILHINEWVSCNFLDLCKLLAFDCSPGLINHRHSQPDRERTAVVRGDGARGGHKTPDIYMMSRRYRREQNKPSTWPEHSTGNRSQLFGEQINNY